jgi:hypothetical protein
MLLAFSLLATPAFGQTAMDLLPGNNWLPGWKQSYEVQAYEGDDLFFLINGGADLFLEYGFRDVAAVELQHPTDGKLYIEVYHMASDSAAFGMFSLRKGSLKIEVNPGPWVVYGDDYLHLWQGPFYVSVSATGLSNKTKLKAFASLVTRMQEWAPVQSHLPSLYTEYRNEEMLSATYILGPLALNNVYHFGSADILKVTEALAVEEKFHRNIILNYPDEMTAKKVFFDFIEHMQNSGRFSNYREEGEQYLAEDRLENTFIANLNENKIILVLLKQE